MKEAKLEIVQGDISAQTGLEAIVNAANAQLAPGGGVAGAVHRSAGPGLYEEAKQYAPIKPGECVLTNAYNLPNQYVIHCLGPRYGVDEPVEELLSECYDNALDLAREEGITTIGFPAISAGAFGYPLEEAAATAIRTVAKRLTSEDFRLIRFVLFSDSDKEVFERAMDSSMEHEWE